MKTMYSYTYGGKQGQRFQLVEAKDLVVIRTKEAAPLSQLSMSGTTRELVPALIPVSAFPEANVTVYKCLPRLLMELFALVGIKSEINDE